MSTSKRATLAVALALSGWAFACAGSRQATGSADLIVLNARVFTAEPGAGQAEAVRALLAATPGLAVHPGVRDLAHRERVCLARRSLGAG